MNDQRLTDLEKRVQDLVQRVPNLPDRLARGAGASAPKLYRTSAYEVLVTDRKWSYTLTPQKLVNPAPALGADAFFEDDADGTVLLLALNLAEDRNTAGATVQGNDVDFNAAPFGADGAVGTLKRRLRPLGPYRYVTVERWVVDGDGLRHACVRAPNAIQEDCQTGGA